jgi:hypothetical protein
VELVVSDHKFDFDYDKQANLFYEKRRIIDLLENTQALPEVEWDAEPVRYFKLNKEWAKVVFGWLTWLEDVAGWLDAENQNYAGIQAILKFEEGIEGGVLMSPEEFKQSLYEGLYKWTNDVAKQIVSGRIYDIAVDEDGNVVPPAAGDDADTPDDDPLTEADETAEYETGRALNWAHGINGAIVKLTELFGVDSTPDTPLADAQAIMAALYVINNLAAWNTAIENYYNRRIALGTTWGSLNVAALAEAIYCGDFSLTAINAYILDLPASYAQNKIVLDLVREFEETQYKIWNKGVEPSTAYVTYGCVPIAFEEFAFDMSTSNTPNYTTNGHWKPGHRYLVEIEGTFVDSDVPGIICDGMYSHNTITGVKTFKRMVFNNEGVATPFENECPFQPSHKYRFTLDKTPGTDIEPCVVSADNGPFTIPNVVGTLSVKITDLGQYV